MPCIISLILNSLRPFFVVSKISPGGGNQPRLIFLCECEGTRTFHYNTTNLLVRTSDVLYNSYSFAVSQSTSPSLVTGARDSPPVKRVRESCGCDGHSENTEREDTVRVLTCSYCGAELASLADDLLHFWSCEVTLRRAAGGDVIYSNADATTSQECFKMIVNSFVSQSFVARPKFLLKNRNNEFLLLWVMDRNLSILRTAGQELVEKNVMKILYKGVADIRVPELHDLECINLSNKILMAGLDLLERSTENLPDSFKFANDYKVSYFDKR